MEITRAEEARAVALLSHDVGVTLGPGQDDVIRHEASTHRAFYNEPDSIDVDAEEYVEKVAEEVQQYFHDCFVDTSWPQCPLHRHHPLWVHGGSWICEQLNFAVARLGELEATRDHDSRYVIRVDRGHTPAS